MAEQTEDDYNGPEPDINNELPVQYRRRNALPVAEQTETPTHCPRCGSPDPKLHPSLQHEARCRFVPTRGMADICKRCGAMNPCNLHPESAPPVDDLAALRRELWGLVDSTRTAANRQPARGHKRGVLHGCTDELEDVLSRLLPRATEGE